ELAEAQKRTELRLEELAEAQKKTELKLAVLTKEHQKTREMVGGLAHTVGYRLEDEAIWALPHLLARDFGMAMETALERTWLAAGPHRYVEVNIWGSGVVDGRRVHIVGEAKSHLMKGDVDKFLVTVAKVHQITGMEVFSSSRHVPDLSYRETGCGRKGHQAIYVLRTSGFAVISPMNNNGLRYICVMASFGVPKRWRAAR
ncbi:MAG: hypothetical protein ACUVSA_02465, partial [Desulfosoma sp.]